MFGQLVSRVERGKKGSLLTERDRWRRLRRIGTVGKKWLMKRVSVDEDPEQHKKQEGGMSDHIELAHLGLLSKSGKTACGLPWWLSSKEFACNAGDRDLIPGSERAPGEGNGNPLQWSCLENPMDRGAWQAI